MKRAGQDKLWEKKGREGERVHSERSTKLLGTYRITGRPVTLASRKRVYQSGR